MGLVLLVGLTPDARNECRCPKQAIVLITGPLNPATSLCAERGETHGPNLHSLRLQLRDNGSQLAGATEDSSGIWHQAHQGQPFPNALTYTVQRWRAWMGVVDIVAYFERCVPDSACSNGIKHCQSQLVLSHIGHMCISHFAVGHFVCPEAVFGLGRELVHCATIDSPVELIKCFGYKLIEVVPPLRLGRLGLPF